MDTLGPWSIFLKYMYRHFPLVKVKILHGWTKFFVHIMEGFFYDVKSLVLGTLSTLTFELCWRQCLYLL